MRYWKIWKKEKTPLISKRIGDGTLSCDGQLQGQRNLSELNVWGNIDLMYQKRGDIKQNENTVMRTFGIEVCKGAVNLKAI